MNRASTGRKMNENMNENEKMNVEENENEVGHENVKLKESEFSVSNFRIEDSLHEPFFFRYFHKFSYFSFPFP